MKTHYEELALSGGAARSAYQFAFVRELFKAGFTFDHISGVSGGAINAYLFSTGIGQSDEGEEIWLERIPKVVGRKEKIAAFFRGITFRESLFPVGEIWKLLREYASLDRKRHIPIDIHTLNDRSELVVWNPDLFTESDQLRRALFAAISIPGMWPIVDHIFDLRKNEFNLFDAGMRHNVPLPQYEGQDRMVIRTMHDVEKLEHFPGGSWAKTIFRAFEIYKAETSKNDLQETDFVIAPPRPLKNEFDFRAETIADHYRVGQAQAKKFLETGEVWPQTGAHSGAPKK